MHQNILLRCAKLESQHWFVLLLVMLLSTTFYFRCSSYHFPFLFWPVLLMLPKPSLFSPSVLSYSLFLPKHKWMHGHLGWGNWGHTLMASHITLPCVIGCRIWSGPCYLNRPRRRIRNVCVCVCIFCPVSARSAVARLEQIQWDGF